MFSTPADAWDDQADNHTENDDACTDHEPVAGSTVFQAFVFLLKRLRLAFVSNDLAFQVFVLCIDGQRA